MGARGGREMRSAVERRVYLPWPKGFAGSAARLGQSVGVVTVVVVVAVGMAVVVVSVGVQPGSLQQLGSTAESYLVSPAALTCPHCLIPAPCCCTLSNYPDASTAARRVEALPCDVLCTQSVGSVLGGQLVAS